MKNSSLFSLNLILFFFFAFISQSHPSLPEDMKEGIALKGLGGQSMQAVILEPADSVINGFPLLRVKAREDSVAGIVYDLFKGSYMANSVKLYYMAGNYLARKNIRTQSAPAYLLLSQNQGGFPQYGFYLLQGDSMVDMTEVPYIELVKNEPDPEDHLGSMTQIYPHEMGHIIYRILSENTDTLVPGGVDIHYSTVTTDYGTAFNEGFAMHFENMARTYEPDEARKAAVISDFEGKEKKVMARAKMFERDFTWPLRFGFYRLTMLTWFQNFEDIKRYIWVRDNRMKYMNKALIFNNPEKSLQFRNAGTGHTAEIRPVQQALATEGVTASFFAGLLNSSAPDHYRDTSFYLEFLPPGDTLLGDIRKLISPQENQYMKIMEVLHKSVNRTLSQRSQLIDFVDSYVQLNPDERGIVTEVFRKAAGLEYPIDPGRELWITNPEHEHGMLVMDQTGGLTVPYYTFNLNAATEADLLTFRPISREEAGLIIGYIRNSGPLHDYTDLNNIPGVSKSTAGLLSDARFDPEFFESLEDEGLSLSLNSLIYSFLKKFLITGLLYFIAAAILSKILAYSASAALGIRNILWLLPRFLGFLVLALAAAVLSPIPALYFAIAGILVLGLTLGIVRKPERRKTFIITTLPIILLLAYALI